MQLVAAGVPPVSPIWLLKTLREKNQIMAMVAGGLNYSISARTPSREGVTRGHRGHMGGIAGE